jgi:hypothetical protein
MPPPLTWHICQTIVNYLSPFVNVCVFNQSRGHWLLNDAFNFAMFISLKLKVNHKNAFSFQTLVEEDSSMALELICLTSNIRKKVFMVLNSFLSFLKKYEKIIIHNMLSLMLDPRFENLHLVFFLLVVNKE